MARAISSRRFPIRSTSTHGRRASLLERLRVGSPAFLACYALAALGGAPLLGCGSDPLARPDLVLVTVGAIPVEDLACHGGTQGEGAELCAVGHAGTRYVWAFSASNSAAPAIASILSGLAPDVHGIGASAASFLPSDVETVAERLAAAGYHTAAFVTHAGLNRSRHFDQGFGRFDDGAVTDSRTADEAPDAAGRAAQWLAQAESPYFAWIHLDPAQANAPGPSEPDSAFDSVRSLDRSLSRLFAVVEARQTAPALLVTSLPDEAAPDALSPSSTRVALLWRPARFGGSPGVARVIRTPVSQLDIAPTLLQAGGLLDEVQWLAGRSLPFRERRAGEPGRAIEVQGGGVRARISDGGYTVRDDAGGILAIIRLPLTDERAPALTPSSHTD